MDTRNPSRRSGRGAVSIHLLVLLVPVLFAFMGFAIDLGRMYLIRAELETAAKAAALASAEKLIGTDQSLTDAAAARDVALNSETGFGNRFNFGNLPIPSGAGLTATALEPSFYETAAAALGTDDTGGGGGTSARTSRYVRVSIEAEAPLTFWSMLPIAAKARATPIRATAVAGISAPLCTACGIEPLAVQALDSSDTTDFGFQKDLGYTFYYQCTGTTPARIRGTEDQPAIAYLLTNHYNQDDTGDFADENTQLYRIGAQGLLPSSTQTLSCISFGLGDPGEQIWVNAGVRSCTQSVYSQVNSMLCGLASRFDATPQDACANVPSIGSLGAYLPDTDVSLLNDYGSYAGNARRIVTVPVVETLSSSGAMNVLGFRQFVVQPDPVKEVTIDPMDTNGRFAALYIGSPMPLRRGQYRPDPSTGATSCALTSGPGMVVLHQ